MLATNCSPSHRDTGDGLSLRPETKATLLSNLSRNGAAMCVPDTEKLLEWLRGTREGTTINLFPGNVLPASLTQGPGTAPLLKCHLERELSLVIGPVMVSW